MIWRKKSGMRGSGVLGTLVIERVFDGLALVTLAVGTYVLLFQQQHDNRFTFVIVFACLVFVGILVFGMGTVLFPDKLTKLLTWFFGFFPPHLRAKLLAFTYAFFDAFKVLPNLVSVTTLFVLSLLIWLTEAFVYFLVALAFQQVTGLHLSYFHFVFIASIASLMTLIPSMPGFAGTFDFAVKFTLLRFAVADQNAQAYTLVLHIVLWLPVTLVGAYFFVREGVSTKKII